MHRPRRAALLSCAVVMLMASAVSAKPKLPPGSGAVSALGGYALPSEIVASSIAWGHLASDKGWWSAVRSLATADAQMLVAGTTVRAQAYAKSRAEPPTLPHRRTHHVWMSCDGSTGAEEGLFTDGAAHGWYLTIWQRQPKGGFKWVLDQSGLDAGAAPDFDFIEGKVADCVARPRGAPAPAPQRIPDGTGNIEVKPIAPGSTPPRIAIKGETNQMADYLIGIARDHTLGWATRFGEDGARHVTVNLLIDGKRVEVLSRTVAPGGVTGQ